MSQASDSGDSAHERLSITGDDLHSHLLARIKVIADSVGRVRKPDEVFQQPVRRLFSTMLEAAGPQRTTGRAAIRAYGNREYDTLYEPYAATIAIQERYPVAAQIGFHIADQLPLMGLFGDTEQSYVGNRVLNASDRGLNGASEAWNAYEWGIRG